MPRTCLNRSSAFALASLINSCTARLAASMLCPSIVTIASDSYTQSNNPAWQGGGGETTIATTGMSHNTSDDFFDMPQPPVTYLIWNSVLVAVLARALQRLLLPIGPLWPYLPSSMVLTASTTRTISKHPSRLAYQPTAEPPRRHLSSGGKSGVSW